MSEIAIKVDNISKKYMLGSSSAGSLRDLVGGLMRHKKTSEEFWALRDVSFDVKAGDIIGIVGKNGAGKSTLLKILSRITKPTSGRAEMNGRVASLLEVGTGFNPELTGKENIFLNGTILGMSKREVTSKYDEIVDFSGVEKFLDTPVKHYSSGMYVRLAFAVAAHLEPEILIIDEVLAVGDAEFQRKCLGKMDAVSKSGRTILFVSHNMTAVSSLCTKGVMLENGSVSYLGDIHEVVSRYYGFNEQITSFNGDLSKITNRQGNQKISLVEYHLQSENGFTIDKVLSGQNFSIVLRFKTKELKKDEKLFVNIKIKSEENVSIFHLSTYEGIAKEFNIGETVKEGVIKCSISNLPLPEGKYYLEFFISDLNEVFDYIDFGGELNVMAGDFFGNGRSLSSKYGIVLMKSDWRIATE